MVTRRSGAVSVGCLLKILILVAVLYFGTKIGQVYWNFYSYEDAMKQQARFADQKTDDEIKKYLVAKADSLGLPEDAGAVTIERQGRRISIGSDYAQIVELPLHVRTFKFSPRAEHDY